MRTTMMGRFYKRRRMYRTKPRKRSNLALMALVGVSAVMFVMSANDSSVLRPLRDGVQAVVAPILAASLGPLEPVRNVVQRLSRLSTMSVELERLRAENQLLKVWKRRAIDLQNKVNELGAITRLVRNQDLGFVTSEVLSAPLGPFRRHAVIRAGRIKHVRAGFPVINGDGLVGMVQDVGEHSARVRLLNDPDSSIPVVIGDSGIHGVMLGTGAARPVLSEVSAKGAVAPGDVVSTSGVDGRVPKGLTVGVVVTSHDVFNVEPNASLNRIEYVSVLLRQGPTASLRSKPKNARK